ncbi:MAG: glycoside hydrolase family 95 protein [Planctomycetia bacterium]|jgi:alpha-L-fucosidase 2
MKIFCRRLILSVMILFCVGSFVVADGDVRLWYEQPAKAWVEAMPLGNGRMAAMVYGGVEREHLALNEESLWAGLPVDTYPENFAENVRKVQQLVLEGKIKEARRLGAKTLVKKPTSFRSYEPFADLWIDFEKTGSATKYRRELDLNTGIAKVTYQADEVQVTREVFISAVDDVIVIRLSTGGIGKLNAMVWLSRKKDIQITADGKNGLRLDGQIVDVEAPKGYDANKGGSGPGGKHMKFAGRLQARVGQGTVQADGKKLVIEDADEVVLLFTGATDYNLEKMNFDRSIDPGRKAEAILAKAAKKSWDELRRDHVAEHRSVFDRVSLDLSNGSKEEAELEKLPTDKRLVRFEKEQNDPALVATVFQFGRYLLMSSSRSPGVLPANLQGIWNDQMWAPWEADYHLNINLQMNYWPADVCNVSGSMPSLTNWFVELSKRGTVSAKKLYGARGWVAFLSTNPFGRTTPSGSTLGSQFVNGSLDPLCGVWMAMTLWRHYEFTQNHEFLEKQAYPVLKGASEFVMDYLVKDKDGQLVIVPSTSPENAYIHPKTGKAVRITRGSAYHTTLVREIFMAVIRASEILDCDPAYRKQLEEALKKLPPLQIGDNGTIMEWIEDYEEREPTHRHVSHLLGLYPFAQITESDPKLFDAARKTLERRGFGGDIGWSNAWKVSFFARLKDGEKARWYMDRLVGKNMFPNMFAKYIFSNNRSIFEIDCNFGASAGVAEMLLQSHGEVIEFLPALPAEWSEGKVTGLRARGGYEVDETWSDGKLVEAKIKASRSGPCTIRYGDHSSMFSMNPGDEVTLDGALQRKSEKEGPPATKAALQDLFHKIQAAAREYIEAHPEEESWKESLLEIASAKECKFHDDGFTVGEWSFSRQGSCLSMPGLSSPVERSWYEIQLRITPKKVKIIDLQENRFWFDVEKQEKLDNS